MFRALIATALREVADKVCRDQVSSITQEHQITSQIGQALVQRMSGWRFGMYRVQVATQDFPDHGRGALERSVGADIFVGVRILRGDRSLLSKGILVQAKRGSHLSPRAKDDLDDQCERMRRRTDAAYVWLYTANGVRVLRAENVINRSNGNLSGGRRLDALFSETLACNEGDPRIGIPPGRLRQATLGSMLEELRAEQGIGVDIIAPLTDDHAAR